MSKKISVGMAVVLMLLSILVTFQITFISINNKYKAELLELTGRQEIYSKLAAVDELYRSLYIGEIDEEKLTDEIIRGYVRGTGDKYAYYLDKEQYAEMVSDNNAEMQGIGIYVIYTEGIIEIISVMPDSPALEAGLEPGDLIYSVDGQLVSEIGYNSAISKMRGTAGTIANFTVIRGYETLNFSITRGYVNEQSVISRVYEPDPTIGIIKILSFDLGTPAQFKAACQSLINGGVTRFIFDVRYNPGGDLTSICEILDYLLPAGPIVRIVDGNGKEEAIYSDMNSLSMPMCVLINSSTASAAELFSSALQDYDKAELVGVTTFGKGTMQTIRRLSDNTGIGISYRMYCPPFSDNYEGIGVKPDYEIEMDASVAGKNIYKISDAEDTQLQKAIEILG